MTSSTFETKRESHVQVFNPFGVTENCFYVALGRLMSLDSTTMAQFVGRDERLTDGVGLFPEDQAQIVQICNEKTRGHYKFVNLMEPRNTKDRILLGGRGQLNIDDLRAVARRHGLVGRCFAVSINSGASMGHFVTVQCTKPQEWDVTLDQPCEPSGATETWEAEDFQILHPCEDVVLNFSKSKVMQIIGDTQEIATVYGGSIEAFRERAKNIIPGSKRIQPVSTWDEGCQAWEFKFKHQGHWTRGWCPEEGQTASLAPEWGWHNYIVHEGYWEYKFPNGIEDWKEAPHTQCNLTGSWGPACRGWFTLKKQ